MNDIEQQFSCLARLERRRRFHPHSILPELLSLMAFKRAPQVLHVIVQSNSLRLTERGILNDI
jgi:hypothetical protein